MSLAATVLLTNLAVLIGMMLLLWIASLFKRDTSIADQFWGVGFVVVAWGTLSAVDRRDIVDWVVVGLVTVWGVRLAGYLTWRKWGEGEDRRYAEMRNRHAGRFPSVSLFTVFLLQGLLIWFVSIPIQAALWTVEDRFSYWIFAIGVGLWTIGFCFEAVADYQLASFKARSGNATKVMDQGLWHFSRHPNYFGDFCAWWGFYLIAVSVGAAWTFASPLVMSLLLLKISGVSLLEKTIRERRPEYESYTKRTNAFIPWPPNDD